MFSQLAQRIAHRTIRATVTRHGSAGSISVTRLQVPTHSFISSSSSLLAAESSERKAEPVKQRREPKAAAKPSKPKKSMDRPPKRAKPPIVKPLTEEDMPPKQPSKPYILFYIEYYRTEPKAPALAAQQQVSNAAAKAWKAMDDAGRQVYHDRHAELRVEYSKRLQEYFDKTDRETLKRVTLELKASHRSVPRDVNRPLRPGSSWVVFLQEQTKTIGPAPPGMRPVELNSKILSERWRALTPEERAPYDERFKQLSEEYYSKTNRSPPIRAATRIASE